MSVYFLEDVSYTVTEYCPGPCRYCSIWKKDDRRNEELTEKELTKVFSSPSLANLKKVHITGGEPHLSETYIKAVDVIYRYFPDTVIDTPITGWYPERHVEVARYVLGKFDLYRLDVSIDGDEKVYPRIRLRKDGFDRAVSTIERLRRIRGCVVRIQFTIYPDNYDQIEWVYHFARKLGVGLYIGFGRFNPERFANHHDALLGKPLSHKDFVPPPEVRREIYRQLENIGFHRSRYATKYYWQRALWEGQRVKFECLMGKRSIDISPYGDVYPCLLWPTKLHMGNIRDYENLDDLLASRKALSVIKAVEKEECYELCSYTCALKARLLEPHIPAHGLKTYRNKWDFVFDENDIIPIKPWWEGER